jgi:hypothetical protein
MSIGEGDGELQGRRLSAILIADIVGYSRLVGADEAGTLRALNAHRRELIDPTVASHRGRFVRTTGDGLILEFMSAVDAVRCAVDVQRGMAERNQAVPIEKQIEYRIGINVGDIISVGDDIYGDGVNIAARLESMSEPGGIYVSRAVRDPVVDKLSFGFEDLGEVAAKKYCPAHPCFSRASRYRNWAAKVCLAARGKTSRYRCSCSAGNDLRWFGDMVLGHPCIWRCANEPCGFHWPLGWNLGQ